MSSTYETFTHEGWYCAYLSDTTGQCSNSTFANGFRPMDVLLSDTPEAYSIQTRTLVPNSTAFKNSSYLTGLTKPAFWLVFVPTLCAAHWHSPPYIDKAKTVNPAVVRATACH
ncbi:hypothetical protein FRC04_005645 [Tulasnella sp. 424]|nr:hypothetical protein FRC04_005645 [Tulasnella sp. 424]KAG8962110.1 hypothetical protein FRC05_005510 [Tulasnella sp. 425]